MNKKEKKEDFLDRLHEIYNDKSLNLTEETRSEMLKQFKKLKSNKTNINYASYYLYPFIVEDNYNNNSKKLDEFLKIILKYRWKSYFGIVLGSAFSGFK